MKTKDKVKMSGEESQRTGIFFSTQGLLDSLSACFSIPYLRLGFCKIPRESWRTYILPQSSGTAA